MLTSSRRSLALATTICATGAASAAVIAAVRPTSVAPHTRIAQPDTTHPRVAAANDSVAGAYLTVVGGCNDCHTGNWDETKGKTPDADRLEGSNVGYRGPWGTTYAANLRLVASRASEDKWVHILTTADDGHGKPPMPWMNTAQTSDQDLRAIYRYIKALGPAGERTPRPVPPRETPKTAYILMVPQGGHAGPASHESDSSKQSMGKTPSAGRGSGKP